MKKDVILKAIEGRIRSEYKKYHTSLPEEWFEILTRKLFSGIIKELQKGAFEAGRELHHDVFNSEHSYKYETFEDYLKNLENEKDKS